MLSNGLGSRSKMETRGVKAGGLGEGKSLSRLGLEEKEEEGWGRGRKGKKRTLMEIHEEKRFNRFG